MTTLKSLEKRVKDLEYVVYRKDVKDCPRCGEHTLNYLQKDVCYLCAYLVGDPL